MVPQKPNLKFADNSLLEKMSDFMQTGLARGDFMPHDKVVAMTIAGVMIDTVGQNSEATENIMYAREREAFIKLAKMDCTYERISSMLDYGAPVRN